MTTSEKAHENGSILINFVLDKSGSMAAVRSATIEGFNEFKGEQTRESGEARFTLTLFDTEFLHACTAVPIREVPDLDMQSYQPDGCTALYDALAHTIGAADTFLAGIDERPQQVLFVVMTDGFENASREFTRDQVLEMIADRRENAGYEFIYLGANQDAFAGGEDIGIDSSRTRSYDASEKGVREHMQKLSREVRGFRRSSMPHADNFFDGELERRGEDDAG